MRMFTRDEVISAVSSIDITHDEHFTTFLEELSRINPHAIYSKNAIDYLTDALYGEGFDRVVSSLIAVYIELLNMREVDMSVRDVYATIYASDLLGKSGSTAYPMGASTNVEDSMVLMDLIALLCVYSNDLRVLSK